MTGTSDEMQADAAVDAWMRGDHRTPTFDLAVRLAEALHVHHNDHRKWWQRRSRTPLEWWGLACHLASASGRTGTS